MLHKKTSSFGMRQLTLAVALVSVLAGCSTFNRGIDYKSVSNRDAPLEIPPQLSTPAVDDRFTVPGGRAGSATASTYNRGAADAQPVVTGVLPSNTTAQVIRAGQQRVIVVNQDVERVWPVVRNFWPEMGFTYKTESQQTGILETDWAEDRARIPTDPIRTTIGRVFEGIYSTSRRDKFRTRIERTTVNGQPATEIYVSHRGVEEIYVSEGKDQTKWNPRGPDLELEMEMVNRLVNRFAPAPTTGTTSAGSTPAAAVAAAPAPAAALGANGTSLVVQDPVDRAWRRVGLALDRGGFTVEDRDRSKATFFVRYIDPENDNYKPADNRGVLDKLAFWRSGPKATERPAYRVVLAEQGGNTLVSVNDPDGKPDSSALAKRMLSVLLDQLK